MKEIPRDDEDWRYTQSFNVEEVLSNEAKGFFELFGFIIFRDVLSRDECKSTIDDMWNLIEQNHETVNRNVPLSWNEGLTRFGMPKRVSALFRPSLLRIRQHKNVFRCFSAVLDSENIICSHDRWLLHRPTRNVGGKNHPEWETEKNVHLDLNPFEYVDDNSRKSVHSRLSELKYKARNYRAFISENNDVHKSMGLSVQGIINLNDLDNEMGGGTILIPGSHHDMESWAKGVTENCDILGDNKIDFCKRVVGPMQYKFENDKSLLSKAQHLTLRPGSLLIWNQCCIHGSTPNRSSVTRYAIPIRFFKREVLEDQQERFKDRSNVLRHVVQQERFEEELTDIGRTVFGL